MFGEVRWAPSVSCEVQEASIDGYQVWLVNDCGELISLLGSVEKKERDWQPAMLACCDESWYSLYLGLMTAPADAVGLAVVPYKDSQLYSPSLLPIMHRTVATTTTTTTPESNESPGYTLEQATGFLLDLMS